MTIENSQLADKVVAAFRKVLSDDAKAHVSDKELHELNLIVQEALSQQLTHAADRVDDLCKEFRSKTNHQDIEL